MRGNNVEGSCNEQGFSNFCRSSEFGWNFNARGLGSFFNPLQSDSFVKTSLAIKGAEPYSAHHVGA